MSYIPDADVLDRPSYGDEYRTPEELQAIKVKLARVEEEAPKKGAIFQRVNPAIATEANASGTVNINLALATYQRYVLTGDTAFAFTPPTSVPDNEVVFFTLLLRRGGNYSITWPESVKWNGRFQPTLTVDGTDILVFFQEYPSGPWIGNVAIRNAGLPE